MGFPPQFLDDIRARLTLSDIVGRHVALKRKGREWTACCPFHKEKTPSFFVNDEKGFYHCFGCGMHGDHIGFLIESQGLSFMDSVKTLADEAGLTIPEMRPEEIEREKSRRSLNEVMELVTKFYEVTLRGPEGEVARTYLQSRGINADTVKKFRLGFAKDGALSAAMAQRNISEDTLIELGLLRRYDNRPKPVEVFRDRLMFPITDRQGNVNAFGGRLLGRGEPKYLNSPETALFKKGRQLYGLAQARRAAFDSKHVIVTEGYMDVIALSQAGLPQTVAPLGTAITEEQLMILWKLVPTPTLALDGDRAGRAAANRAISRALPILKPGLSLKFAWLPDGEDPDSLVSARGLNSFSGLIANALPLSEALWQAHFLPPPNTPEERAGSWHMLQKDLAQITDQTVRGAFSAEYEQKFANEFGIRNMAHQDTGAKKFGRKGQDKKPLKRYEKIGLDRSYGLSVVGLRRANEAILITLLLNHPEWTLSAIGDPTSHQFSDPEMNKLIQSIFISAVRLPTLDKEAVHTHVRNAGLGATIAQFDTSSMRTKAGITDTQLSKEEFSAKVLDIWGKLTGPTSRPKPRLR